MTHKDVLTIFPELKPRTLISWSEKGLLDLPAYGRGTKREYTLDDIYKVGVLISLAKIGLPFKTIKRLALGNLTKQVNEGIAFFSIYPCFMMVDLRWIKERFGK